MRQDVQERRHYAREFKQGAVDLCRRQGYSYGKAAGELGIPVKTLANWVREAKRIAAPAPGPAGETEDPAVLKAQIRELQRQLARSEMEKEILKKVSHAAWPHPRGMKTEAGPKGKMTLSRGIG